MMALINMVGATVFAELVLFAKQAVRAADSEVGLLFAAGGAGVVVLSLAAGPLREGWAFRNVALGALLLSGLPTAGFAYTHSLLGAVLFWGPVSGARNLFNTKTPMPPA